MPFYVDVKYGSGRTRFAELGPFESKKTAEFEAREWKARSRKSPKEYRVASTRVVRMNPSKRKTLKRVGAALKKWIRGKTNASRVKGHKVKGGRAVTLKNMKSVTITRKSNGVVSVHGVQLRGRKR